MRYTGSPGNFCSHWFREQFTGYVWLEGTKEFKLHTDDDHQRLPVGRNPDTTQCCKGSADRCGDCSKRYFLAYGCNKNTRSGCMSGHGCRWTVYNQSRCSDDYSDNTGFKIGYSYDSSLGKNVPAGQIADNGEPIGLTSVIRSNGSTTLMDQWFNGDGNEFEPGWYPIQAWYTRSNARVPGWTFVQKLSNGSIQYNTYAYSNPREGDDNEYFDLQWRDNIGSGSFENVPSSSLVPCLASCGSNPGAATTPISPSDGETNVSLPVTLTWTAPNDWGETCGSPDHRYNVYAGLKNGATCPDPGPSDYSVVCSNISEGTNTCPTGFFNLSNAEYCWYVETNNGEFSTLSATNGSEVWWFKTEDPITNQQWMTTLYGDFYAGKINMQFPDFVDYVPAWNPPHISYESAGGPKVSSLASYEIEIATDHPKLGTEHYYPESESKFFVKNANFAPNQTWPENYTGTPPASAEEIKNCSNMFYGEKLKIGKTYKADVGCVNAAIENVSGSSYRVHDDGIAILYVTGNQDLRFNNEFLSSNANQRIVFVTGPDIDVKVDRSLDSGIPTQATPPEIESAFVVNKSFEFEGSVPDTSVVVEGPLIARSVLFNRNRGLGNAYPSEIVKYNADYLYGLTSQERDSIEPNYSGLFIIDVDWVSE
ncbi:hypothetical protein ACFLZK_02055 [Patescibacteria group bacterium]